jgi:DNA-binding response OmpR family regulator
MLIAIPPPQVPFTKSQSLFSLEDSMKPTRKVLVVDDEELVRDSLKHHLTQCGYDVREAVDGVQAIEEIVTDHFDLVICDGMMPNKTGWDVLRKIKSNPKTTNIPVIVIVAKKVEPDIFNDYELGADYYMNKPFTRSQVLGVIRFILDDDSEALSQASGSN